MINHDEQIRRYVADALKSGQRQTVVQLKISQIDPALRKDSLLSMILTVFHDVLSLYGQAFCLKNDDIFVFYSQKINDNTIKAATIKTWLNFSDDSNARDAKTLEKTYTLPADGDALQHEIARIANGPARAAVKKEETRRFVLPPAINKNQKLFTPEMLARVTQALQNTDFSNVIRRQPVCIILEDSKPQPLFEEVFVSIADLSESVLPGVSLTATPWLFQDLTETLDKRVLHSVSQHDDGAFRRDFSLNLNISTILSEDFREFDDNIRSAMKSSIVLELQPIDIFSDLQSYLCARDYTKNLGYKICVDGVTAQTLPLIDRERLGVDYVKLTWNDGLPDMLEQNASLGDKVRNYGANRTILCRVDDEKALDFAEKYDITLFQGRYIQHLLYSDPRNRRVGSTLLHRH